MQTDERDIYSEWAALPQWEKDVRRFYPDASEFEIKALRVAFNAARLFMRGYRAFFTILCGIFHPKHFRVCLKMLPGILRGEGA